VEFHLAHNDIVSGRKDQEKPIPFQPLNIRQTTILPAEI
jgi:hypothetical protein